jgi:regulatory protein
MKQIITAIRPETGQKGQRSRIYLDGSYSFSLENELISAEDLKVGQALSKAEITLLSRDDKMQRCLKAAQHFLSYRARSESETRERLLKRGFEMQEIESTLAQLKQAGLLDDPAFARAWKEDRDSFKPRSRKELKSELKRKGIEAEVINQVAAEIDERGNARRLASQKARKIHVSDYQVFSWKLGGYLQSKGFDFSVINDVVKEAWQERSGDAAGDSLPGNEI